MNKKYLFISPNEIIAYSVIEENIDQKILSKSLATAQETALKPILGVTLYNSITTAIEAFTLSGTSIPTNISELIDVVKPYLIAKTTSIFIQLNQYKVTAKGLMKLNDNSATNLSEGDKEAVIQYYNNLIAEYKRDIIKYLKDSNQYSGQNDVQSTENATGWFLGIPVDVCDTDILPDVIDESEYVSPTIGTYTYSDIQELNKVLLVSEDEIIASSVIEQGVDSKLLAKTVQTVQQVNLRPILTDKYFYTLLDGINQSIISGATLTTLYQDMLVFVKPYLINKVVAEFLIPNTYKLTNKGLLKLNSNSADNLTEGDLQAVKDYNDNLSTTYKRDLVDFLQSNKLVGCDSDDVLYDQATGWFLGANYHSSIPSNDWNVLPSYYTYADTYVTGGTYNSGTGSLTLVNSTGGTFNVGGFLTPNSIVYITDVFSNNFTLQLENNFGVQYTFTPPLVTGGTFNNGTGTLTLNNTTGGTFSVSGFSTGSLTGGTDVYVTGGTFNAGTLTLVNTTGGTFTVSGFTTGSSQTFTDTFVTGGTYSNGTAVFTNTTGGTFNVSGFSTGATSVLITGGTFNQSNRTLSLTNNTGGTITVTGITDTFVTGGTYTAGTLTLRNNSGGTFSVSGLSDSFVSGSGTTNFIPKWTGGTGLVNSQIFDNGTNVGINTITPAYKFDVNGTSQLGGSLSDLVYLMGGNVIFQYNPTGLSELRLYSSSHTMFLASAASTRTAFGTVGGNVDLGTTEGMMFLGSVSNTSGTKNGFGLSFRSLHSSGSGVVNIFNINPEFNQSSANTSTIRGFYYNPTFSQSLKGTNIAWESTSGDIIYGHLSGGTTRMVVVSPTGQLSAQTIPTSSGSSTDTFITGGTFTNNNLLLVNTTGGTISTRIEVFTAITATSTCLIDGLTVGSKGNSTATVIGNGAGGSDTFSVSVGFQANAVAPANSGGVAVGYQAMLNNTAANNTAVGYQSLHSATTGTQNAAFGGQSMQDLATGSQNSALGYRAGRRLGTGSFNTMVGNTSMLNQTSASGNTSIGYASLAGSSSGSSTNNVAIGYSALRQNTSGNNNTAIGFEAGDANISGSSNVFIGYNAGKNSTGNNQLIIANNSGSALIGGDFTANTVTIFGTLSATTYLGLPTTSGGTDTFITGGTFNQSNRTLSLNNNTGGTVTVTGITDTFITGGSQTLSSTILTNNTGGTVTVTNSSFTDWTDYSSSVSITGLTSLTTKQIQYMVMGKTMFVQFDLRCATPNATGTTRAFSLPFNASSWAGEQRGIVHGVNNVTQAAMLWRCVAGSNIIEVATAANDGNFSSWTNGAACRIEGQMIINIA